MCAVLLPPGDNPVAVNKYIISNLFCYKTLHVSGIFFAHHQGSPTVHSSLVSFMQVVMTASKLSQDGSEIHPGSAWKPSS
jgi:hypothetical protein